MPSLKCNEALGAQPHTQKVPFSVFVLTHNGHSMFVRPLSPSECFALSDRRTLLAVDSSTVLELLETDDATYDELLASWIN